MQCTHAASKCSATHLARPANPQLASYIYRGLTSIEAKGSPERGFAKIFLSQDFDHKLPSAGGGAGAKHAEPEALHISMGFGRI